MTGLLVGLTKREGHDFGPPNLDALGVFFFSFVSFYTGVIALGLFFIFASRNQAAVRIRDWRLIFVSTIAIHIYLTLALLAYPLNGDFKCGAEFWSMSTVFPLGIAIFQGRSCLCS